MTNMNTNEIIKKDNDYIAHTYGRFPLVLERGEGSYVWDSEGNKYIDMASGIAVTAFGHGDKQWLSAVNNQLGKLAHTSNLYYSEPCTLLAEELCKRTGMGKVFFSNSGAEANECAIKAARKYSAEKKGSEYYNIITLKNSFHGRTVTTLAATGQDVFHADFTPLTEGFLYAEANNLSQMEELLKNNKCAAVMFEPVQGEGGVMPLDYDYVKGIADLAVKYDVLIIADEVQTGNGRTGKLYGYMHYPVKPDILSTAKGLGGGLPIGATLMSDDVAKVLTSGSHGSTFGGNPVSAAGALSIIKRIDDALLADVAKKGEYIKNTLSGAKGVLSVSGLGLMIGVKTEKTADEVVASCRENGVLVIKAKDKVRLLPPLNISEEDLEKAVLVIKAAYS